MEKFFYQEAPEKYWDFEALKNPPAFQDDYDESSACDGLRAIIIILFLTLLWLKLLARLNAVSPTAFFSSNNWYARVSPC